MSNEEREKWIDKTYPYFQKVLVGVVFGWFLGIILAASLFIIGDEGAGRVFIRLGYVAIIIIFLTCIINMYFAEQYKKRKNE